MANKKLFDLELKTEPATTDNLALGKAGSSYKNITAANLKTWILKDIPAAPTLISKVVNVGAFDMYPGEKSKEISLGVVRSKIRSCTVLILSNDGGLYPLSLQGGNKEIKSYWFIRQESTYASNAKLLIMSENNSFFDQTAFNGNGPSGNRGYITVWYVE